MSLPDDKNAAAIYAFFSIGSNDEDSGNNLSQGNFESLLTEIVAPSKKYNPVPLQTILDAQKTGSPRGVCFAALGSRSDDLTHPFSPYCRSRRRLRHADPCGRFRPPGA